MDLLAVFKERQALLEGHFLLTSGLHSPRYLQCARVLMDPELATRLGQELAEKLRPLLGGASPTAVVAPALGGVLVAHEVARGFGCRGLFTERQDGVMTLRRGFELESGEPVVVVEDVITTGGSTREVLDCVRARGAQVLAVGSLVDRSGGEVDLGLPRASLLPLEVEAWEAASLPAVRPGKPAGEAGLAARSRGGGPLRRPGRATVRAALPRHPRLRRHRLRGLAVASGGVGAARSRERSRTPSPASREAAPGQGRGRGRGPHRRGRSRPGPGGLLSPRARVGARGPGPGPERARCPRTCGPCEAARGGRRLSRPPQRALEGLPLHPRHGPRAASHPPPLRRPLALRPGPGEGRRRRPRSTSAATTSPPWPRPGAA